MTEALKTAASLSASGGLVILALLLGRPLLRDRLSKRWQYYIWLVAVARLLLPLSPEAGLVGRLFQQPQVQYDIQAAAPRPAGRPETDAGGAPARSGGAEEASPERAVPETGAGLPQILFFAWLGGALLLLVRRVTAYQSFARCVRAGCREVSRPELLDRLARLGEQAGVRRPVELLENPLAASPMLLGMLRPRIILPSAELPEEDFRYTALHELTHCRRWDLAYKWLVQAAVCLHWFNPLAWLMEREISRACELACDEAVLRMLEPGERRAYGATLLRALETGGGYGASPGSATLGESAELLKERLTAIMKFKKQSRLTAALSLVLAAALVTGASAAGAYTGPAGRSAEPSAASAVDVGRWAAASAAASYEQEDVAGLSIAFPFLDRESQENYLEKCYDDGNIALFASCLSQMEPDSALVDAFAERARADGSLSFFSVLAGHMDRKQLESWMAKASEGGSAACLSVLLRAAGEYEELEALESELEARQLREYGAWGITGDGGDYYYDGQLVRVFQDVRPDLSFVMLEMNPQGAVDVKVTRNRDGEIESVARMTGEEVRRLFGDLEDPDDENALRDASGMPEETALTVPVNFGRVAAGGCRWLGEYTLTPGDRICYDVSAETGNGMAVGFAPAGEEEPGDRTCCTVSNRRTDGVLRCASGAFTVGSSVAPGRYRLFLRATDGVLGNVSGSVTLDLAAGDKALPGEVLSLTGSQLPAAVQRAMERCEIRTWYVVRAEGRQYLSCQGFPWSFAWSPSWEDGGWHVSIRKIRQRDSGRVLLSLLDSGPLTVDVDGEPVQLTEIEA